jgi:hypothetical protein
LPAGVTYNAGTESLEGAANGTGSGTPTFTLSRVGGSDVVESGTTVTLGGVGSLALTSTAITVAEGDLTSVTTSRSEGSDGAIAVDYTVAGVGTTPQSGTLNWAAGEIGSKSASIRGDILESTTTGSVTLSNARRTDAGSPAPTLGVSSGTIQVVNVDEVAWNLPATLSVQQDGNIPLRQYTANATGYTISVSGLPAGVTYNASLERLEGASTGTGSATATFTLTLGGTTVVDTATVSLVDQQIHDFTGLPLTSDGWTDLDAMITSAGYADALIMYVAANGTSGGSIYTQAQVNALGGTPTNPASTPNAFATIEQAYANVRDGFPDVVLLRRGDSWARSSSFNLTRAGRNSAERQIISAYGPTSTERPIFNCLSMAFRIGDSVPFSNAVISDIRCIFDPVSGSSPTTQKGFMLAGNSHHVLIEGITLEHFGRSVFEFQPVALSGQPRPVPTNYVARRNLIYDTYSSSVYFSGMGNGILFEDNVVDSCAARNAGGTGGIQSCYVQYDNQPGVTFRGNIFTRNASGIQTRVSGDFSDNLFVRNAMPLTLGQDQAIMALNITANRNLILESIGFLDAAGEHVANRGWGIYIQGGSADRNVATGTAEGYEYLEVEDNIIANLSRTSPPTASGQGINIARGFVNDIGLPGYGLSDFHNPSYIRNNIVYDWKDPLVFSDYSDHALLTIENNLFHAREGQTTDANGSQANGSRAVLRSNQYFSGDPDAAGPFRAFGSNLSYAGWQAVMDDASSVVLANDDGLWNTAYGLEPSIAEYHGQVGGVQTFDAWIAAVHQQRRGNWNESLTARASYAWAAAGFGR